MPHRVMTKLLIGAALLSVLQAGCHCIDRPYEPIACSTGWDPVFGSSASCGTCGGDCEGHTPASYLGYVLTCGSGCGDIYWGEWSDDPPSACDPCDNAGNWIGPVAGAPPFRQRLLSGWWDGWGSRIGHGGSPAGCGGAAEGCTHCSGAALPDVPEPATVMHTSEARPAQAASSVPRQIAPDNNARPPRLLHSARFTR